MRGTLVTFLGDSGRGWPWPRDRYDVSAPVPDENFEQKIPEAELNADIDAALAPIGASGASSPNEGGARAVDRVRAWPARTATMRRPCHR